MAYTPSTAHLARLAICTAGINWRTGRIWRVDGDIEIAALDCHPPFTAWLNTFWRAGVFCNRLYAVYRPYSIPGAARAAGAGLALLIVQIALGGWMSSNYATLACPDFPTCLGAWLPAMDFKHGFQ